MVGDWAGSSLQTVDEWVMCEWERQAVNSGKQYCRRGDNHSDGAQTRRCRNSVKQSSKNSN